MKKVLTTLAILVFLTLPSVSAAHFIIGFVEDSHKGISPEGLTAILYKEDYKKDFIATKVGLNGSVGIANTYMFDCEMLNKPCNIGDSLVIQVLDSKHRSKKAYVTVTGAGFDIVSNTPLIK